MTKTEYQMLIFKRWQINGTRLPLAHSRAWKMSVGTHLLGRGCLMPKHVLLLTPGPRTAHCCSPQHPVMPCGPSPTGTGPMPLPKVFISEGVSKLLEQSPSREEVSKPEQIQLFNTRQPGCEVPMFSRANSQFPQTFSRPEDWREARIQLRMSARNRGALEETKGTFWQWGHWAYLQTT